MRDADVRFHEEWLGLAQPVEGLVFSVPALADAQIAPKVRPSLTAELEGHLEDTDYGPALRNVRDFFESFLGYSRPGMLIGRDDLDAEISFYAPEGRQNIRPSFAIARGPFGESEQDPFAEFKTASEPSKPGPSNEEPAYVALVWDLATDAGGSAINIDLDEKETETGPWRYPPTAKLERLLRNTGIPIGFLSNRRELRIVYAPAGESSAHLTFRFKDLAERAGRPLLAALELIFHAERTYGAAPEFTFEGLLRESRLRQADVTKDLADQVFEAVEILLEGIEHAAARDCVGDRPDWLRAALEEPGDHFYQGILSVVLRLVFILYAEDQSLLPVHRPTYRDHLSILDLFERLSDDAGSHPESMHLRFGAYGRLIALFRVIFLGVERKDLELPPRHGKLFDPSAFPFLEGGLPGWTAAIALPEERAAVELPSIDDNTIYRVLHRLVVFKGQRLSYRSLDVEQIGAVYESLMGYHALRVESPAVRLGKNRVWAETEMLRSMKPTERKRFWKDVCGLPKKAVTRGEAATKRATDAASLAEALVELAPGTKSRSARHRAGAGRLVLQPGEERRRTGSHYTPRSLSEKVARRTLEPILACLGEERTAEQILSLKICDPAMGSGAFLVAACRLLAEEVVHAWDRSGESSALAEQHGDALLHARRLVAQRCLYGVDKNPAAVELAKLSLWLITLSRELPFTFVDHALRHGDSLVGLDLEQVRSFHWKPQQQLETCSRVLEDALGQALDHRDQILALADKEDAVSQREKQRLLEYAEQATDRIRTIADVCIGAFFARGKPNEREKERSKRLELINRLLEGAEEIGEELQTMAADIRRLHAPFHWMIEFPEVFFQGRPDPLQDDAENGPAFMEAFMGNPPYMGGSSVSSTMGDCYRDWLLTIHPGAHGNGDLSAHFFRRSAALLGAHGAMGLIATNTIAQGDTRTTGLAWLHNNGFKTYDATRSLAWEGGAVVTVALVHLAVGTVAKGVTTLLDGRAVSTINSRLRPRPERKDPVPLAANDVFASNGIHPTGTGFIIDDSTKTSLETECERELVRVFRYVGGKDINENASPQSNRWIIFLTEDDEKQAWARWPHLMAHVEAEVKPGRMRLRDTAISRRLKSQWWRFWADRPELQKELSRIERCIVLSRVSKHLALNFGTTKQQYSDSVCVFPSDKYTLFAILQSRIHEVWARLLSSSLEDRLRYAASDCFETFPFPQPDPRTVIDSLETVGAKVYERRSFYMHETQQGLTKTYNALKDPINQDPRIIDLRRLHEEMDCAVLTAYGWRDIKVPCFCLSNDGDEAASQEFEDEVIDRLYVLNAERAREERRLGIAEGKRTSTKRKARESRKKASADPAEDAQEELF